MKVVWRDLTTVLTEEEVLDKGFSRGKKAADRVDDPVKVFRVRKQLTRMVQTSADVMFIVTIFRCLAGVQSRCVKSQSRTQSKLFAVLDLK